MLFIMQPIRWVRSQKAIERIATSFDIILHADGVILYFIFRSYGLYSVMEEERRPRAMIEFKVWEYMNFDIGFFYSNFLSFLFLFFVILGR